MDLVGGVRYIESRLGKQKSYQGKDGSAKKYPVPKQHKHDEHKVPEFDAHVGRIIDITA